MKKRQFQSLRRTLRIRYVWRSFHTLAVMLTRTQAANIERGHEP